MPPMPMIGILIAWKHSQTMRTAIGRMAGPLRPPSTLESFGRRVSTSMAIARNVLTSDTASAPASSAARANDGDVGHIRRELGDEREARDLAHGAGDVRVPAGCSRTGCRLP